jgi:epidermal growth factor receptor substrate 15
LPNYPQQNSIQIWNLSEPGGRGALDRNGFFVALKLVSFAQSGKPLDMAALASGEPPLAYSATYLSNVR